MFFANGNFDDVSTNWLVANWLMMITEILLLVMNVMAIGVCFGFNCGYAINPARDFAPRLFTGELFVKFPPVMGFSLLTGVTNWST